MVFTSSSSAVAHKVVARHGNLSVRLRVGEHRGWAALNDQLCGRCTVFLALAVAGSLHVQNDAFSVLDLHAGVSHELISFLHVFLYVIFICSYYIHVIDVTLDWVWSRGLCVTLFIPTQPFVYCLLKYYHRP